MSDPDATTRVIAVGHTPGPWKAVPNPMRADGMFIVRDVPPKPYDGVTAPNGEPLWQLPPAVVGCQVTPADARLIAAAPEMLALCREAASLIRGIPNAYDSDLRLAAKLEAIVEKAEGQA